MDDLKLYPLVGLKSLKIPEAGGAWRLFTLAKNISGALDHIERNVLQQAAADLGIKEYQFKRWLDAGRRLDLFTDVQRMTGEWMLILPSQKKAVEGLGGDCLGKPVTLPAKLLFNKGWRGYVFASWQASTTNNGERLVSQKKQSEITGVKSQTQTKLNKQAGVKSIKNYAISNVHANNYAGIQEYGDRACMFEYWDESTHQKKLGWRLPNTRVFPLYGDISNSKPRNMSLFNRTPEQYSKTTKLLRNVEKPKLKEFYTFDRPSSKGNHLWIHSAIVL